jgi:hypothetical protein
VKLSTAKAKVIGLQLGEAELNVIRPGVPPIRAKFALLDEDATPCGYVEKANGWSEKTMGAMQALVECMEEDALKIVFMEETKPTEAEKAEEPPQF